MQRLGAYSRKDNLYKAFSELVAGMSPYLTEHLKRFGRYDLDVAFFNASSKRMLKCYRPRIRINIWRPLFRFFTHLP